MVDLDPAKSIKIQSKYLSVRISVGYRYTVYHIPYRKKRKFQRKSIEPTILFNTAPPGSNTADIHSTIIYLYNIDVLMSIYKNGKQGRKISPN